MTTVVEIWETAQLIEMKAAEGEKFEKLSKEVDALGAASAVAQSLRTPITTIDKCISTKCTLILARQSATAIGLLKLGQKHLYYWRKDGSSITLDPLCVLDFFVSEKYQRSGVGRLLFDALLTHATVPAQAFAYDRPSPKMLPFLAKHFGLTAYQPQPTNFVIFDLFFSCFSHQSNFTSNVLCKPITHSYREVDDLNSVAGDNRRIDTYHSSRNNSNRHGSNKNKKIHPRSPSSLLS